MKQLLTIAAVVLVGCGAKPNYSGVYFASPERSLVSIDLASSFALAKELRVIFFLSDPM
tara:strand:+ start:545 stop:721 length:177 start_codon:yes stop_codon:yes gene_type:complete